MTCIRTFLIISLSLDWCGLVTMIHLKLESCWSSSSLKVVSLGDNERLEDLLVIVNSMDVCCLGDVVDDLRQRVIFKPVQNC